MCGQHPLCCLQRVSTYETPRLVSVYEILFHHNYCSFYCIQNCFLVLSSWPYNMKYLTLYEALRSLNNKLREEANKLEDEIDDLAEEIDNIQPMAERASSVEEDLRNIAHEQHTNVDKIIDLVNENEYILDKMRVRQRMKKSLEPLFITCVILKCEYPLYCDRQTYVRESSKI